MSNKPYLEVKNIRFKAYIGGIEVPFTAFSMQGQKSGYSFSIAIPPTKENIGVPHGTYAYVKYSYSAKGGYTLLCDGYLVSDTPFANRGVFSRQLIFRDMFSSLRFFYIDNSLLESPDDVDTIKVKSIVTDVSEAVSDFVFGEKEEEEEVSGEVEKKNKSLLVQLMSEEVDIIGKIGNMDYGTNLLAYLGHISKLKTKTKSLIIEVMKSEGKPSYGAAKDALNKNEEKIEKEVFISLFNDKENNTAHTLINYLIQTIKAKGIKTSFRKIYGVDGRVYFRHLIWLELSGISQAMVFGDLSKLAMDMMYSHGGITDYMTMYARVITACRLQSIVVPGMSDNQVVVLPDTPYLPVLECNKMETSFDSISVGMGNDIPTTNAVSVFNMSQSIHSVDQPYFGTNLTKIKSHIKRLSHVSTDPLEYIFNTAEEKKKAAQNIEGLHEALNNISNSQLNIEALKRTSITISTGIPNLGVVAGFGFKLDVNGSLVYGNVSSFSLNVTTSGISQTITLSHVVANGNVPVNPYLSNKKNSYAMGVYNTIGLYTAKSARNTIDITSSYINDNRFGKPLSYSRVKNQSGPIIAIKKSWENSSYFGNPSKRRSK